MDIFGKKLRLGAVKGHYITYIPDGAKIIGTSGQNKTNCFINKIGKGISFFVPVPIERMMDRQELFPDEWQLWVDFYNNLLDKIGYLRKVRCDNSMLEIMPAKNTSDNPCLYIVNHSYLLPSRPHPIVYYYPQRSCQVGHESDHSRPVLLTRVR